MKENKSTKFFELTSKLVMSTFHASLVDDQIDLDELNLDICLFNGEYENLRFPIQFKQTDGKKLTDILDTGYPNLYLISERLKLLLEEQQFNGWKIYPVEVRDKKNQNVNEYHGFSIIGKCDSVDYEKSTVIEKKLVPEGPICKFYKGIMIEGWDGSDFFSPPKTLHIFVTEKVVRVIKKHKITNLKFQDLEKSETNFITNPKRHSK